MAVGGGDTTVPRQIVWGSMYQRYVFYSPLFTTHPGLKLILPWQKWLHSINHTIAILSY